MEGDDCPRCGHNDWSVEYKATMSSNAKITLTEDRSDFILEEVGDVSEQSTWDTEIWCSHCDWKPGDSLAECYQCSGRADYECPDCSQPLCEDCAMQFGSPGGEDGRCDQCDTRHNEEEQDDD